MKKIRLTPIESTIFNFFYECNTNDNDSNKQSHPIPIETKTIFNHFTDQGLWKSTIYRTLQQLTEKGLLVKKTIPTSHKTHGGSTTICTYSTSMTKEIYQLSQICNSFKKNIKKIKRLKRRK